MHMSQKITAGIPYNFCSQPSLTKFLPSHPSIMKPKQALHFLRQVKYFSNMKCMQGAEERLSPDSCIRLAMVLLLCLQRSVQQVAGRDSSAFREIFLDRSMDGTPLQLEQGGEFMVGLISS